jgi:tryptophan synthase alpha chain
LAGTDRQTARKRLVVYLMADDATPDLAAAAVEGGADTVEIGFPFSDPLADGPVIRRAAERALAAGMRTSRCLEVLARARERCADTPLVPMTYSSIFDAYGWQNLRDAMRAAGATSVIVADLPIDERPDLRRVQLVAPTTHDDRIRLAASVTDGWLYLVTVTGVTGAREHLPAGLPEFVARVRTATSVPLYAGFGIATPSLARSVAALTDGVVVGSAAVEAAERGPAALREFVHSLREALDTTVATPRGVPSEFDGRVDIAVSGGGKGGD